MIISQLLTNDEFQKSILKQQLNSQEILLKQKLLEKRTQEIEKRPFLKRESRKLRLKTI